MKNASGQLVTSLPWGAPGDTPLVCDVDTNGIGDRVMVRPLPDWTLDWYIAHDTGAVSTFNFGSLNDTPKCANDYDGDGKVDLAVFSPSTGQWRIRRSSDAGVDSYSFGLEGDIAP